MSIKKAQKQKILFAFQLLFLLVASLCVPHKSHGKIIEIPSFEALKRTLLMLPAEADKGEMAPTYWVAFDIDQTLIYPAHAAGQAAALKKFKPTLQHLLKGKKWPEKDRLFTRILLTPHKLLDPNMPSLIKALEKKGLTCFGFTSSLTTTLGQRPGIVPGGDFIEQKRHQKLASLGIHFAAPPLAQNIILRAHPPYEGNYPCYYNGLLFANGTLPTNTKGTVLVAFLKALAKKGMPLPTHIVLIDDGRGHLESTEKSLKETFPTITFTGLHFTAAIRETPRLTKDEFRAFWLENLGAIKA